jgi:hypothetical protein
VSAAAASGELVRGGAAVTALMIVPPTRAAATSAPLNPRVLNLDIGVLLDERRRRQPPRDPTIAPRRQERM